MERATTGGFPGAVKRSARRRDALFDSYLTTLVERDVLQLSAIERRGELLRLLALPASRVSAQHVPTTLASHTGLSRTTVNRYLELLTEVFLIKLIPAWTPGPTCRAVATPKLAFVDSGIAASLMARARNGWTSLTGRRGNCWRTSSPWRSLGS